MNKFKFKSKKVKAGFVGGNWGRGTICDTATYIVCAATPQLYIPLRGIYLVTSHLKMTRRTPMTTGNNVEAGQEVSKLQEEYYTHG